MKTDARLAWIGLGRIGRPMAERLASSTSHILIFDANPQALAAFSAPAAKHSLSAGDCAADADVLFTSLPNDQALDAVVLGPGGVMNRARAGLIFVDTSTVSPHLSKRIAERANERGVLYLRMPVSGNPTLAREGRLTALVSGPADAWSRVQPLVASFTAASRYVGDSDQARYMKLVVNLLVANFAQLMAEALTLGRKGGLDWAVMIEALAASPLASPWLETKFAALKARDFTATFPPQMMLKDVDLILDAGRDCDVPLLMTSMTRQILQSLTTESFADEDFFVTVKALERQAGLSTDL